MTTPSEDNPDTDTSPWKITLGELDEKMGVKITEESVQRVVATMPVEDNRQSFGLLHGGESLAVGEAVGSWAAVIHASTLGKTAVGIDVSATHHRSARQGQITITATPIHLGGTLTTHEVLIANEAGQRLCTMRITNLLMTRGSNPSPPMTGQVTSYWRGRILPPQSVTDAGYACGAAPLPSASAG